jgi:ABC-type glycerol-3-phosphate transport system substrate-binding protein
MKNLTNAAIVAAAAVALAACGGSSSGGGGGSSPTPTGTSALPNLKGQSIEVAAEWQKD